MRGLLRCELGHGATPRRGWRMAWYEPRRRIGVFFPVPLHWLARAIREFVWRIGLARRAPTREQQDVFDLHRVQRERQKLAAEYARGYLQGWHECLAECIETLESADEDPWSN